MKRIAIIGSTGSIGVQALDVARKRPDKIKVLALAAGSNLDLLRRQAQEFKPEYLAVKDGGKNGVHVDTGFIDYGQEAVNSLATLPEADIVLVAVSGAAGIEPTLNAVEHGKVVALANKESLVAAGEIIMARAAQTGARIIPVDSEHSAIFQCLRDEGPWVYRLWLTASGGPFRDFTPEELERVTPEMALQHPRWKMGKKITIDSATLMNKGLEVIEAHHLFNISYDQIKVVIHPQSIIHSLVEFNDGSLLGHLGVTDMRIPIQYALSYPERWQAPCERLDLASLGTIQLKKPDPNRFPALALALEAGRRGGTLPAVMNAANEMAVQAFLAGRISFTTITRVVEEVMNRHETLDKVDIETILSCDQWARTVGADIIGGMN